jgi:uncharacterized protein (TIGR03032 family)
MTDAATPTPAGAKPWLEVSAPRTLTGWLTSHKIGLAATTYQTGKLLLFGQRAGQLSVFERTFNRCMELWADGPTMWMSTIYQLWRFSDALDPGSNYSGYDRLYVPRIGHTTGDLDVHDVAVDAAGRLVFVATKFNCLATLDPQRSFAPLWHPPFISRLAAEDRCHLNGLALEGGHPRYVTAVGTGDVVDSWRDRRHDGGVVIDLRTNRTVASGLSMPHSPRVHRGRLWVLNSGTGEFGYVDGGKFTPLTFCPGYLRGLAFVGDFAVVGLSRPRHDKTFSGLPLDAALARRGAEARCGLQVIDLHTGYVVEWVRIEGQVSELYDVVSLTGTARRMALGFKTEEIQRLISVAAVAELFPHEDGPRRPR